MDARFIPIAIILLAFTAAAQGKGGPSGGPVRGQGNNKFEQCVYNQGGYVMQVTWFTQGTLKATQNGGNFKLSATKPAFKTETLTLGEESCVGGKGTKHSAALTIKGGDFARIVAIAATDIGAVAGMVGCGVGAVALTAITAGGGAAAGAACEVASDALVGVIADPSIIPDAKTLFAVVQPPATKGSNRKMIVTYGTVFDPKTKVDTP